MNGNNKRPAWLPPPIRGQKPDHPDQRLSPLAMHQLGGQGFLDTLKTVVAQPGMIRSIPQIQGGTYKQTGQLPSEVSISPTTFADTVREWPGMLVMQTAGVRSKSEMRGVATHEFAHALSIDQNPELLKEFKAARGQMEKLKTFNARDYEEAFAELFTEALSKRLPEIEPGGYKYASTPFLKNDQRMQLLDDYIDQQLPKLK
jgi:hypothetical protein